MQNPVSNQGEKSSNSSAESGSTEAEVEEQYVFVKNSESSYSKLDTNNSSEGNEQDNLSNKSESDGSKALDAEVVGAA